MLWGSKAVQTSCSLLAQNPSFIREIPTWPKRRHLRRLPPTDIDPAKQRLWNNFPRYYQNSDKLKNRTPPLNGLYNLMLYIPSYIPNDIQISHDFPRRQSHVPGALGLVTGADGAAKRDPSSKCSGHGQKRWEKPWEHGG